MKRFISISLIFCLVVQTFTCVSFLTFYQFNGSFITAVFCVNKDKPALHCEGKCFITKQVTKDKQQQEHSSKSTEMAAFHLYMPDTLMFSLDIYTPEETKPVAFYKQQWLSTAFFSTFHPPKMIC